MKTIFEPFRIKSVEPIRLTTEAERQTSLIEAGHNLFKLRAVDVQIDLLTDSGTGAMSSKQWGALLEGDESYAGASSFFAFESAVREVFGHQYVIPTHQGRASERLMSGLLVDESKVILGNTHFDTTRANIEYAGGLCIDLPCPEASDLSSNYAFKGNIDLDRLAVELGRLGAHRVPFVLMTVTNNSGGGQPVSMANIKAAKSICDDHGVPLLIDAARFAENAWFIRMREQGYSDKTPKEIAQEMFSYSDGAMMSMKKDAFGNIGGLISLNSNEWVEQIRSMLILTEGFPTYGGLAGRDMAALAVGLREILEPNYLSYRIRSTAYVGEKLDAAGIPTLKPFGGHAIYLDGRSFCAHLSDEQLPAWSLSVALYLKSGVRACEIGNVMFGRLLEDGGFDWPSKDLVRLAIPRRVYTQSHMDFVIEEIIELYNNREQIKGLRFRHRPEQLPHFTATFDPVE